MPVVVERATDALTARATEELPKAPARHSVEPIANDLHMIAGRDLETVREGSAQNVRRGGYPRGSFQDPNPFAFRGSVPRDAPEFQFPDRDEGNWQSTEGRVYEAWSCQTQPP
jgi:hypothetical protein